MKTMSRVISANRPGAPTRASTAVAEQRCSEDMIGVTLEDGTSFDLDHGRVVIAAITSLHQHLEPVCDGRGRPAGQECPGQGLSRKPWVKTSLAPGSTVVTDYLDNAGLTQYLDQLQFNLVGYGAPPASATPDRCPEISAAIDEKDLVVCSVLSGNRNFEGRISQGRQGELFASPPLVVAYALAGRMDIDIQKDLLGNDADGNPVYLDDIWPDPAEVAQVVGDSIRREMFEELRRCLQGR